MRLEGEEIAAVEEVEFAVVEEMKRYWRFEGVGKR